MIKYIRFKTVIMKIKIKGIFVMKIAKGYRCEKCNSGIVNLDGRTTLFQHQDVGSFTAIEGLDRQKRQVYEEARRRLKEAHEVFKRLSEKHANFKIK